MKKLKKIPKFRSEQEEREFWLRNDSSEYIDYSNSKQTVFKNLKPTTKPISIRLPEKLIDQIKSLANERDIPYQSYIKTILHDKIEEETKKKAS